MGVDECCMTDASSPFLAPVIALVLWTFVTWGWLHAARIPAIRKSGRPLKPDATR